MLIRKDFVFVPLATAPQANTTPVLDTAVTAHPPPAPSSPQAMPVDGPPSRKVKRSMTDNDGREGKFRRTATIPARVAAACGPGSRGFSCANASASPGTSPSGTPRCPGSR